MLSPEQIAKYGTEHATQTALLCWASDKPELRWLLRIGNEDNRSAALGARARAAGLRAGVADVLLPLASLGYHGLWIEFKNGRNKQSKIQIEFMNAMINAGYYYAVCYTWKEAANLISQYLRINWPIE